MDIIVWVRPFSPDSARVAVAYRQRVPDAQVKRQLARLTGATGWSIDDLHITNESVNPQKPKLYPVTTSAVLTLHQAPQIDTKSGTPALMPYLSAFQDANRVEVLFTDIDLGANRGFQPLESASLSLRVAQNDRSGYVFDAEIRDHTGKLPVPSVLAAAPANPKAALEPLVPSSKKTSASVWPMLMVVVGAGLLIGVVTYLLISRRPASDASARILHP